MPTHHQPTTLITKKLSYQQLSRRVFSGDVLRFGHTAPPLITAARDLCCAVFATHNPTTAHRLYKVDDFLLRSKQAQDEFNTPFYRQLLLQWLHHIGIQTDNLYWDTLGLRIAPPIASHQGGFRSTTQVHRDTWGTGIQTQINWWAPIYPLASGRTMQFFPRYWREPLANTTAEWSFSEFLAHRKAAVQLGRAATYPSVPHATAKPDDTPHKIRINCGEIIAFSAAHLHSSVPNRTALTRFSFEIRTIDPAQKKGAPNCDCHSTPPLTRLFRACHDPTKKLSD